MSRYLAASLFLCVWVVGSGDTLADESGDSKGGEKPTAVDARDPIRLTHGPMLGAVTANSIRVWARTSDPGDFFVHYGVDENDLNTVSVAGSTSLAHDNTGVLVIDELQSDTRYFYQVHVNGRPHGLPGTFRTLPSAAESMHPELNPEGLFNFRFEVGSCANQNPLHGGALCPPP